MLRTLAVLSLLVTAPSAMAWWNEAWGLRKAITLDTSAAGLDLQDNVSNAPVLLRLHAGNFNHFMDLADQGADLRVVAGDDLTPLSFRIEKLDPVNEQALVWVTLPALKAATTPAPENPDNKLYLYFGNPEPGVQAVTQEAAPPALRYSFDAADGRPADSSPSGIVPAASTAQAVAASLIGGGVRLGPGSYLRIPDDARLAIDPARGWAASLWLKLDAETREGTLLERAIGKQRLALLLADGQMRLEYTDANGLESRTEPVPFAADAWQHVALLSEGGQFAVLIGGKRVASLAVEAEPVGGPITIGANSDDAQPLAAEMDELRISVPVPAAPLVQFAALTEGPEQKGIAYLADESIENEGAGERGAGHTSYFGVILNQVFGNDEAIVEQSVIVVCGLMALVAFVVMGLKATYLARCRTSSRGFLEAYEGPGMAGAADISVLLAREDDFSASPLFRVYRTAMRELQRRLDGPGASINLRSLQAIQASMDATMVRESQQLNAQMVLLTIAISGGPFIGLLGTVVGVMVTFAAIAASGDVNINAIAPGMAAALLATTAGLAVAIPALFGYNYLGSRIKEQAADMHVFADELAARINERHGQD